MKKFLFLSLLGLPVLFLGGCSLINNNDSGVNTGDIERISQLENQLSGLAEDFSGLQAENKSLKKSLSKDTTILVSKQLLADDGFYEVYEYSSPELGITLTYERDNQLLENSKIYRYGNFLCITEKQKLETLGDKVGCIEILPSNEQYSVNENLGKIILEDGIGNYAIQYNPYIIFYSSESNGYVGWVYTIKTI